MMNGRWHTAMPMQKKPTLDQRIKWHIMHHTTCHCRAIPGKIAKEMKRRKIIV
ncbi:MAG: hypothetical protein KBD46_02690 [Candidatus Levybacteria bacterium]|nr:hypothetical protein [Candidatus Levybacteria bacterium]